MVNLFCFRFNNQNLALFRQILATVASCFLVLCHGITLGHTAVLLPLLKEDDTFEYNDELGSWIASITPLSMIVGSILNGIIIDKTGRRVGQMLLCIPNTIGWLCIAFSYDAILMIIGRAFIGLCSGAVRPVTMVFLSEISDPKYRGIILSCPSIAALSGILLSHLAGHYLNWRIGCFVCMTPTIITFIIVIFLKESPIWLISKGEYNKGSEVFEWFRGSNESLDAELKEVLHNEKTKADHNTSFIDKCAMMKKARFYNPLFTVFVLLGCNQVCSANSIPFYAEDILNKTFKGSFSSLTLVMVTDGVRVLFSMLSCLVTKLLPRKFTWLCCSFGTVAMLFVLGALIYFHGLAWVILLFMVLYIGLSGMMTTIGWSFTAELFPTDLRGICTNISAAIAYALLFIVVKVTPTILFNYGEIVLFTGSAVFTLIFAVIAIFTLPKTDGKTLIEIEKDLDEKSS